MLDKRKRKRNEYKHPVVLQVLSDHFAVIASHPGALRDISTHGARLESPTELPVGAVVKIKITIDIASGKLTIAPNGRVKWVRKLGDNGPYYIGVELTALPAADYQKWAEYAKKKAAVVF